MAFLESCSEKAAALAGGLVWLTVGGDQAEPMVMAAVASAGLAAVVGGAMQRPGPESARRLRKIQSHVRASIADWQRREGVSEADLAAAEAALDRSLAACFVDRQRLAASAVSEDGFPHRATALVLEDLALREPIFAEPGEGSIARRFATEVVVAALKAAVEDEAYFRKLQPLLLLEIARALGPLQPMRQLVAEIHGTVQQLAAQRPAPAAVPVLRQQLPRQLDRLVGRDGQRRRIAERLTRAGQAGDAPGALCVIEGMPGLGKSALALAVASDLAAAFPDFHFWFELGAHSGAPLTPAQARDRLLRRLEPGRVLPGDDDERWQMLRAAYHGDDGRPLRGVVVIDDCGSESALKSLLPPTPVPVLVTTRRAMALGWSEPLAELDEPSARELVVAIDPALSQLSQLDALVAACPRLPLVLRAVAAALKKGRQGEAGVRRMVEALRRRPLAAAGDADAADGVRAVLATSIAPLSEPQRRAWSALAVMTTAFDLDAAVAVADGPPAVIDELVERYLLETDPGSGRCRWHDLMRALAFELTDPGGSLAARARHLLHFTGVARATAAPYLTAAGGVEAARQTLDREWGHVAEAMAFALRPEAPAGGLRDLAMALTPFQLRYRLGWPEIERFWQQALGVFEAAGDAAAAARCLWGLGDVALMQDFYEPAARLLQEALARVDAAAEPVVAAWLHYALADVLRQTGDEVQPPCDEARKAQALFAAAGHAKGVAECDQLVGQVEYENDASADGEPHLSRALAQFERLDDGAAIGSVLAVQGRICHETDRPEQAIALSRQALALAIQHGDVVAELNALVTLGLALTQTGPDAEAAELLAHTEARARRHGNRAALAWAWYGQAQLAIAEDRPESALRHLEDLQPLAEELGTNWAGEALLVRAEVLVRLGRSAEAWALCADAGLTHPHAQERVRMVRVQACLEAGDAEGARPEVARLVASTLDVLDRAAVADAVVRLARLDRDQDRPEAALAGLDQAAPLYAAAGSDRDRVNLHWQRGELLRRLGRLLPARAAYEAVRESAVAGDLPVAIANAEAALARIDVLAQAHGPAEQGFAKAIDAFVTAGRPAFAVQALLDEYDTWWEAGELRRARAAARAAHRLARRHALGDEAAAACERDAARCTERGHWRRVVPLLARAAALRARGTDRRAEAATLARLVEAALDEGDDATALRAAERGVALSCEGGSADDRCGALLRLARSVWDDDRAKACRHLDEAARIASAAGLSYVRAIVLNAEALMAVEAGEAARALERLAPARELLGAEDRIEQAWLTHTELGALLLQGDLARAQPRADELMAAAVAGDAVRLQASGHAMLARLAAWRADPGRQRFHAEQVLALRERHGPRSGGPLAQLLLLHAGVHAESAAGTQDASMSRPATAGELVPALTGIVAAARRRRAWGTEIAALVGLAHAEAGGVRGADATPRLQRALALARAKGSRPCEMEVLFALGQDAQARTIQDRLGLARDPLFRWSL